MTTTPELVIAGTGAMACLFGARLAVHTDLTLLGTWPEGLAALKEKGITLVEADGSERTIPVRATDDPGQCVGVRQALVLVKSWQTERAARQLAECLSSEGVALTLQNGLGNLEQLQQILGAGRAALGVTTIGATLLGPGRVRAGGVGPTHMAVHPRLGWLIELLRKAGYEVEVAEDIESLIWGKLAINAGINPLTALLRMPNGELLARPHTQALMKAAAEETALVAAAKGVELPYAEPGNAVAEVARRTANNRSSMLQDVSRNAPTEIDAICGAVVKEGERLGIPTPVNWTLWYLVRSILSSTGEVLP
ncbi:MAG: 2-dehydropantoate 2-reductase [Anaerolineales bacterium]|jgi:2-dehydropantoate 2-reductase